MPIHDWTRVGAHRFHDFHQKWTVAICNALNTNRLPAGYFAIVEQRAAGLATDVHPPRTRSVIRSRRSSDKRRANRVTVRHPDGDVVAMLEIVSPGNKDSRHALHSFARRAVEFLRAGIHRLIVDLFPPNRRTPQGIHKVLWDRIHDEPFTLPADKPLTVASYAVGTETVAYVEPVAVGDVLPEMPLFLSGTHYVPCPLEETYQTAWEQFPVPLRGPLEPAPPGDAP